MTKIKAGDYVCCINDSSRYGYKPPLTKDKNYLVVNVWDNDVVITDDLQQLFGYDADRFKLVAHKNLHVEEKQMNKQQAQERIEAMRKELEALEKIVNAPDVPKFKPVTIEIDNARAAYVIFHFLCNESTSGGTHDIFCNLASNFRSQMHNEYADTVDIKDWLKSQF